jgi:hypothetical protein
MLALHAASRTLLAAAAFASFGGAFMTTPLAARVDAAAVAEPAPTVAALAPRTAFADVVPHRDPFAGGDAPGTHTGAPLPALQTATTTASAAIPALPPIPAALRALPPNAGAGDTPFPFAGGAACPTAVVTAVVTGAHPFALVDEGGMTRLLTVGDRIGADAITAIGSDGVRLTGGTLLPVARSSDAVAAPQPQRQPPVQPVTPPIALPTPPRSFSGGR